MTSRRDFARTSFAALGALSFGARAGDHGPQAPAARIDGGRLNRSIAGLARFGANPQGGVSRLAYTDFDLQGRAFAKELMQAASLEVRVDTAGNIMGWRSGSDPALRPIMFGSHIDSVPEGGNYDGPVGSLGAIEVARTLKQLNIITRHPIEVVIFQNEEGGTVGSRAMIGELVDKDLTLTARSGKTLRDGIAFVGGNPAQLQASRRRRGDVAAYVELHIEQGGNLDRQNLDIGVVEGIVGISWWDVAIEGFSNHAGTTPMNDRRDSMLAFARFTDMVNRVVTSVPGRQVGTVGRVAAFPGAPNVIPGRVTCSLELRDLDAARIDMLFERVSNETHEIEKATGTKFSFTSTHDSQPALTDPRIQKLVELSARNLRMTTLYLPSGAGHDAQHMARICPSGMIFVPSVGGISHAPTEFTSAEDITNGANVLLHTILALDAADWT
ncbi:MAG: Zn-dependent hydrolase [Gemmatimonadota bacterium]